MTIKTRKYLFILFFIIYIISTPLVCLYAVGYRFKSGLKIQRTGILIVNTKPNNAMIYLNDKLQQNLIEKILSSDKGYITSPAKLKNLLPGEYVVRLEKDGYWTWQKKLTINPGQTTFIEHVNLFKKNLPLQLADGKINNLSLSSDKKRLVAANSKQAILLNTNEDETVYFFATNTNSRFDPNILWSPSQENVLINNLIFKSKDWLHPIAVKTATSSIKKIKWAVSGDDNMLYFSDENSLKIFNLYEKSEKSILNTKGIADFVIKGNFAYYVSQDGKFSRLAMAKLNDGSIMKETQLPSADYEFINQDHNLLNLYDKTNKILYLIDAQNDIKPILQTINNVKSSKWIDDKQLLYANEYEVWIYTLDYHDYKLLTRISNEIDSVIPYPNDNYILFSTKETINSIELDDREKYNITELIKLDKISNPWLNKKGDILYFYAQIGQQEGVYELSIE